MEERLVAATASQAEDVKMARKSAVFVREQYPGAGPHVSKTALKQEG
jgi:hypothetical protein